jgi:spore germination protein GerM
MLRTRLLIVVLIGLTVSYGCTLGPQGHPVAIDTATAPATGPTSESETPQAQPLTVFLVRDGRLVEVKRSGNETSYQLSAALAALVRSPSKAERAARLRTALPAGMTEIAWRAEDSTIVLTLPPEFERLTTAEQVIAIAQLVYTATQNSDAEQISFSLGDGHIEVPVGDGRLVSRPVNRQDYQRVAPQ